jgi:stage II sporulation protein D
LPPDGAPPNLRPWRAGRSPSLASPSLAAAVAPFFLLGARADELSASDKRLLLYSNRFSFNRHGLPLLTVEIMGGQRVVSLRGDRPLTVYPDGDGGPRVQAGAHFTVTARDVRPGRVRWWTVVARRAGDADVALWRSRGYDVKTFETGIVFGVEGDVIDSRAVLVGVAPADSEAAAERTRREVAARWGVETHIHPELVARPEGVLVARDAGAGQGAVTIENRGVLWFAPAADDGLITVEDVVHGGGGARVGAERRETRAYRGRIYVTLGLDGGLSVVNAVAEDQLLMGIVPAEIFADAPADALKAQAVAARDELLSKVGTRHFLDPFLLCATQHCQVYGGAGLEDARTTRAVAATRGEVLLREGGGLVEAYYSASCGGFGEHNENVWNTPPDPALRGHLDALGADARRLAPFSDGITDENIAAFLAAGDAAFCGRTRYARGRHRWSVRLAAADVDRRIAAAHPGVGAVRELRPARRGVSGRVTELLVVGARGQARVAGELTIRRLFGGLKSSLFVVRRDGDGWVFDGAGFGHGVGMCQTGAIGMAEAGHGYREILEHYYRGARVRKLY